MRSRRRSQVLGLVAAAVVVVAAFLTVGLVRAGAAPTGLVPAIELGDGPSTAPAAPVPTRAPARVVRPAPVPAGPAQDDGADDGDLGDDARDDDGQGDDSGDD